MNAVIQNARLATMAPSGAAYGLIDDGAVALVDGRIAWVGDAAELPCQYARLTREDLGGRLVTPALIDCHTHLVYGGNRALEFEKRLQGVSYEEIARAGGGIKSTVAATRAADEQTLLSAALSRVDAMIAEGVATIEIKSGYGLDIETELRMMRVARLVAKARPVRVCTSFLGAHAVPAEYQGRADAYLEDVCLPAMSAGAAEGLIDAVDGFCEGIAFSVAQMGRVFSHARGLGLPVKLHAEQLSNLGGAAMAAEHGALSADHLEFIDEPGVDALARAGTVAVLLPGAFYFLRETRLPPVDALRARSVPMAIATDSNPGSPPITSLLLAMNMAATLFRLTPEEALAGAPRNAAMALGLTDSGQISAGKRADLAIWDVEHPAELVYRIGGNPLHKRLWSDAQ